MLATLVDGWLARFEAALGRGNGAALRELFHPECHWRDLLAFTGDIRTVSGVEAVVSRLQHGAGAPAHGFRVDPERTSPRETTRAGEKCIEAIFRFEGAEGPGAGVLENRSLAER